MAIYQVPVLDDADLAVIASIDALRTRLRFYLAERRRWYGTLRRATYARAVQGSNSIEGYHASVEDVAAVLEDEEPLDAGAEVRAAIAGYRDAMTYVLQLAGAGHEMDASTLRSLQFMIMRYDLTKNPGQWRPGAVWVENASGTVVYDAPPRESVESLVGAALDQVNDQSIAPLVRGAMGHLNLALIHPFSDGNGRAARCVQSFVLASAGVIAPEFSSIEEYLGRNTQAYYDVLTEVAQGSWSPERSARPWLRFCLTAHHRQARTLLHRIRETEALWDRCSQLVHERGVNERTVDALCDAARGRRFRRSLYIKVTGDAAGIEVNEAMATRDLAALVRAGLLVASGEKRGRTYGASDELREVWRSIRSDRGDRLEPDPYDHAGQGALPGLGPDEL